MIVVVTGSNVAVQHPINDWLTYVGADLSRGLPGHRPHQPLAGGRGGAPRGLCRLRVGRPAVDPLRRIPHRAGLGQCLPGRPAARHHHLQPPAPGQLVAGASGLLLGRDRRWTRRSSSPSPSPEPACPGRLGPSATWPPRASWRSSCCCPSAPSCRGRQPQGLPLKGVTAPAGAATTEKQSGVGRAAGLLGQEHVEDAFPGR